MTFSILIVDDHPLMSAALAGVLQALRPRVACTVASTGAAARQALAREPDLGLVVLDLALPDTDGFGLLAYLREVFPDVPVMVVSASEKRRGHAACLRRRCDGLRGQVRSAGRHAEGGRPGDPAARWCRPRR